MKTGLPAQIAGLMRNFGDENPLDAEFGAQSFTLAAALASPDSGSGRVENMPNENVKNSWDLKSWVNETDVSPTLVSYNASARNQFSAASIPLELQLIDFSSVGSLVSTDSKYVPEPEELEDALRLNQITLLYQPTVDLTSGRIVELEAIPHWHHITYGLIPLDDVEYASNTEFIESLAKWGFACAAKNLVKWRAKYPGYSDLELSTSACNPLFEIPSCLADAAENMRQHGLNASAFSAQLDSEVVLPASDAAQKMLSTLRDAGFRITLESFEGGIGEIAAIKNLPIRTLKFSAQFTAKVGRMQVDPSLSRSVIGLAKSMNLRVVATGVETAGQLKRLRSFGCDIAQGSLFARPLSAEEVEPLLSQRAVFFQLVDSINDFPGGY
jgi:EAL domain-containing protein (putative c-di-GMP-specific phosphodiesterase class I)